MIGKGERNKERGPNAHPGEETVRGATQACELGGIWSEVRPGKVVWRAAGTLRQRLEERRRAAWKYPESRSTRSK